MRARLASVGLLLVLLATTAAVCGCGATLDPVARAATRTSDVSTMRFSMTMTMQLPTAPAGVSFTAKGAVDSAAKRLAMSMDLSGLQALSTRAGLPRRLALVEDGPVVYMGGDGFGRLLRGKSWLRLDLGQLASRMGVDTSGLLTGQTDPRVSLAQLRGAGNVVEIGPGVVRGVPTTRYDVLLDVEAGLDRLPSAQRDAARKVFDRLEQSGHRYVPADVWIDGLGYLRRVRITTPDYLGTGGSVTLVLDLFGFGKPVDIGVPSAADTLDAAALPGVLDG